MPPIPGPGAAGTAAGTLGVTLSRITNTATIRLIDTDSTSSTTRAESRRRASTPPVTSAPRTTAVTTSTVRDPATVTPDRPSIVST